MINVLVTGGAGFIGSKLAERLVSLGEYRITVIDNLSNGKIDNIPIGCNFVHGNIQENSTLEKIKGVKFDVIFHLAAQSSGEISFLDPQYDLETNTLSTLKLLK